MDETRPLLQPHGHAHDKPGATRLRPRGHRVLPSGTRFAPVWDAKPHAPTPYCGARDSCPNPSGGAVGCVRSCGGMVRRGWAGRLCGDSRAWGVSRACGVRGNTRMSSGLSRAWDLTPPVTSTVTCVSRRTRMSQRPGHGRHKPTPTTYAGLTACLRCDDVFESWDRRQNRLCNACRQAIEEQPSEEPFQTIHEPRRRPQGFADL
jgi:hypothetical protein